MAEAWDAIASGYAQRAASFTGTFAPELLAAARVDAGAAGGSGAALLDVAAGSGAVALAAAALPGVSQVLACDISPAMLDELQAMAASLPPDAARIETTPCDCTALPMADSSFDAAVSNFGVIFAPDVAAGLAEMARVTRPGGRLAFTTWGRTPAFSAIEDTWRSLLPATAPAAAAQADGPCCSSVTDPAAARGRGRAGRDQRRGSRARAGGRLSRSLLGANAGELALATGQHGGETEQRGVCEAARGDDRGPAREIPRRG